MADLLPRKLTARNVRIPALFVLIFSGFCACAWAGPKGVPSVKRPETRIPLAEKARETNPERYRYAVEHGAKIMPTPDGRSFYLIWVPPNFDHSTDRPMVVTLHGQGSGAFDEFALWHPHLEKHGIGIIALQWRFGSGDAPSDGYAPQESYAVIEGVLKQQNAKPRAALLHGSSRAAADVYALAALDHRSGNDFFGLILADSGGIAEDYAPSAEILSGASGRDVFKGTHWAMFCGERDENPERGGCAAMQQTSDWVRAYGGIVELFIQDPEAGSDGFHLNPEHVEAVLAIYGELFAAA